MGVCTLGEEAEQHVEVKGSMAELIKGVVIKCEPEEAVVVICEEFAIGLGAEAGVVVDSRNWVTWGML